MTTSAEYRDTVLFRETHREACRIIALLRILSITILVRLTFIQSLFCKILQKKTVSKLNAVGKFSLKSGHLVSNDFKTIYLYLLLC